MSYDFTINQGESVAMPFYWYSGTPVTKAITAITLAYPPVFTAVGHGLPTEEIPATINSIRVPRSLNTPDGETVYALKTGTDTFSVAELNASGLSAYTTGGYLRYTPPTDITGYTARMMLRTSVSSVATLASYTSTGGELVLGTTNGKITLTLTAAVSAALSFDTAVYDLELVSAAGIVTRVASGTITLSKEVTR